MGGEPVYHSVQAEPWKVTLIDTGEGSMTGGRIRRIRPYLPQDRPFFLTYGDGVADIDIDALLQFHQAGTARATVTAVRPLARFGRWIWTAITFGVSRKNLSQKGATSTGLLRPGSVRDRSYRWG